MASGPWAAIEKVPSEVKKIAKKGENLQQTDIIYTLTTRLDLARLETEIDKIDKDAFIIMHSINDAKGGMIKKRPLE